MLGPALLRHGPARNCIGTVRYRKAAEWYGVVLKCKGRVQSGAAEFCKGTVMRRIGKVRYGEVYNATAKLCTAWFVTAMVKPRAALFRKAKAKWRLVGRRTAKV